MPITITRRIISSTAALEAVEAAVAKGGERGVAVVAAVVDIGGDLVACLRADGAFSALRDDRQGQGLYRGRVRRRDRRPVECAEGQSDASSTASPSARASCCSAAACRSSRAAPSSARSGFRRLGRRRPRLREGRCRGRAWRLLGVESHGLPTKISILMEKSRHKCGNAIEVGPTSKAARSRGGVRR